MQIFLHFSKELVLTNVQINSFQFKKNRERGRGEGEEKILKLVQQKVHAIFKGKRWILF